MKGRKLYLDVADYTNKIVCNLYDNQSDLSGQAHDVIINYERNGWKEISFSVPSVCHTDTGEEENYRLKYLIADYRLRVVTDDGEDWFLLTDEGVRHENFAKDVTVTAGHISKLLKTRALDLEFSDDEGNNVGTADQFLQTILEGTGWKPGKVAKFYEDDGETVKIRSMNAAVKTGAFRLIQQMCELFEAKPVFNGDYTVDILPMNPFSKLEPGEIPDAVYDGAEDDDRYLVHSNVIELHYDKNIKSFERHRNTDNLATRLYAYGAYGDTVSKYCSIQTAKHDEYLFTVSEDYPEETEFQISDKDGAVRYFTAAGLAAGTTLIWSMLDPTSKKYVWDDAHQKAYHIYSATKTHQAVVLTGEYESVVNYFPFLSDYSYYEDVGLLTEDAFQAVAAYQRDMARYYKEAISAQAEASQTQEQLSTVGVPFNGFLKLDVAFCDAQDTGSVITINWDNYPYGVIYRSDYLEAEKHYFSWHVAQKLKENGDPVSGVASIVYVLHKGEGVIRWECAYLKDIDGRTYTDADGNVYHDDYDYALSDGDKPKVITLWKNIPINEGDDVFLFCTNSFSGKLGPKFSQDEAALLTLQNQTTYVTEKHPTLFVDYNENLPDISFEKYGWCYQYNSTDYETPGTLYFAWVERGDTAWKSVYMQDTVPNVVNGAYFLNTRTAVLWHGENGEWVKLDSVPDETKVAKEFGIVFMECRRRDMIYKGLYDEYAYITNTILTPNNYAFYSAFGYYWLFTTDQTISNGDTIKLDVINGQVYQDSNVEHIVSAEAYPYNTLIYPSENDLDGTLLFEGSVYVNDEKRNGTDMSTDRVWRTNYIPVWPNEEYQYSLPEGATVVLYDVNRQYLGYVSLDDSGVFSTATTLDYGDIDPYTFAKFKQTKYIRITIPKDSMGESFDETHYLHLRNYLNFFFANDKKYRILAPVTWDEESEPQGINTLIRRFKTLCDKLYIEDIPALQAAQNQIVAANKAQADVLGDILREGWWQDSSYVEGDEQRMYNDALDNVTKIAEPEINYTFDFLDLYGTNHDMEYYVLHDVEWPDIKITDAPHLIDQEISINQWGYFDKVSKCFDQPWKTTVDVDTQLTLMGQHEFKDVMTRIAEVAAETKAKQTVYKRAEVISTDGTIDASDVTGEINTEQTTVTGGSSGWKTDAKGNMVLLSADGLAALKFSGNGLSMANSKNADGDWNWKPLGNGFGLSADSITSGNMKGDRIEAGSITADKLMANVGAELDIGSNKALNLYATMDGVKPTGSLKSTDGIIQIVAGSEDEAPTWKEHTAYVVGDTVAWEDKTYVCIMDHTSGDSIETSKWKSYNGYSPAMVNIGSGGSINLIASGEGDAKEDPSINLVSGGAINLLGAELNMVSGNMNIEAGGNLYIGAGGTFTVKSGNFSIDEEGNVNIGGGLNTNTSARIGGWVIGTDHIGNNKDKDESSVGLAIPKPGDTDDIVFWAGNKNPAAAPFRVYADGTVEASSIEIDADITHTESTNATIKNPKISGGVINGSEIKNAITDDVTIRNSVIELGAENNAYKFSVDKNGYANIANGTIRLVGSETQYTEISDAGKLTAKNADIQGNISANGTLIGTFQGNASGRFDGKLKGDLESGSTIAEKWAVASDGKLSGSELCLDPEGEYSVNIGETTAYIKNTGDAKFKTVDVADTVTTKDLTVTGNMNNASSREVKRNIMDLEHRDAFDELRPVSFRYKDSENKHFGLIYEETKPLYPEICHTDNNGSKGIAYMDLIAVLIKEVQDLRMRVSELERSNSNG